MLELVTGQCRAPSVTAQPMGVATALCAVRRLTGGPRHSLAVINLVDLAELHERAVAARGGDGAHCGPCCWAAGGGGGSGRWRHRRHRTLGRLLRCLVTSMLLHVGSWARSHAQVHHHRVAGVSRLDREPAGERGYRCLMAVI